MTKEEKPEAGKHRDPLNRRRGHREDPQPEVLGNDVLTRLTKDKKSG